MATVVLVVVGTFGALLSWFLATSYFSAQQELGVVLALAGFVGGALAVPAGRFLKIRTVRLLLQYDGWFLHPKRPINKLWILLVMALLGRKDKGSMQYQDYLPSYPLPSLKSTCKKYLDSVQPLLTEEDFSKTKLAAEKFVKKDGSRLQWILRLRALKHRNWLYDWWKDYIYLKQRTPIPFNSNYYATGGISLPSTSQLDRAAMLLYSGAVYPLKVRKGQVTNQRVLNAVPFCMDGTKSLVMACRVPGVEIDHVANYAAENPRHAVVLRRGKFYKLDVISRDGQIQSPLGIRRYLEKIVEMAGDDVDHRGVCSFTALPRAKWAEVREKMMKKEVNRRTLRAIESSGVVLSLETDYVDPSDFQALAVYLWHGRIHNRWFDKAINVSVCEGGAVGANIEHSMLDALYPGQHWEYMMTDEEYDESGHVLEPFQGHSSFEVEEPVQ